MQPKKHPSLPAIELVRHIDGEAWTTSTAIAEKFGKRHNDVLRSIRNLECSADFRLRNFAQSSYVNEQGKTQPCFNVTRDGFSFLAMGFTGSDAAKWKEKFIEAFNAMEKRLRDDLSKHDSIAWVDARQNGKHVRLNTTDTLKMFIEYAKNQGSRSAEKYYMQVTKMGYQGIFIIEHAVGKHFRDRLGTLQLIQLATAEGIIIDEIRKGMAEGLHYKEIYRRTRDRVEALGRVIGKTLPAGQPISAPPANSNRLRIPA